MKITMLVPYFKPEITAVVHLLDDLAVDLSRYGADVSVITGFPLRGTSEEVREQYISKSVEIISNNLRIIRVGSKKEEGNHFFIRGFKYIIKTHCIFRNAKKIKTDVYFIYSTPPVMGIAGSILSKKAPTLYCLQDIFPGNLIAQGKLKGTGILYSMLRAMENFIYKRNHHIITISNDMKANLIEKGVNEDKISVIGNWVDTDEIKYVPRVQNPIFDKFKINRSKFYVTYCGNLGYAQDITLILECAKLTAEKEPDISYIIVGNGACEAQIKKQVLDEDITNVNIFPLQPEEDSARVYSIGDIGLVTLKPSMIGYAMPSKTWTMMAASQPVICTAVKETQLYDIIKETGSGITVRPGEPQELASEIINLYENRDALKTYGEKGRDYVETKLSRKAATKKYYDILRTLSEKKFKNH